ncbi:MAG: BRO family protein [Galactobacter sp.]
MNELTPFTYLDKPVRVVDVEEEPWFVASDVAKILGYRSAPDMTRRLDDEDQGYAKVRTPGGDQQMTVINESGLYDAVFRSNAEGAKPFRRWVTSEVLPSIRKTGSYAATPQTYADALRELASSVEAKELAQARAKELEPKAHQWDVFLSADGDVSVADAAKELCRAGIPDLGRDRLFRFMGQEKWTFKDHNGDWKPYQAQVDAGRLRSRANHPQPDLKRGGYRAVPPTIRVTAKGVDALYRLLTKAQVRA